MVIKIIVIIFQSYTLHPGLFGLGNQITSLCHIWSSDLDIITTFDTHIRSSYYYSGLWY